MELLTRERLDSMGCATPNCMHDHTILYLNSGCHPKAGKVVTYDKRIGAISIVCKVCKKPVADIAVAPRL